MDNFNAGEYTPEHIEKAKKILFDMAEGNSLSLSKESMLYKTIQMLDDLAVYILDTLLPPKMEILRPKQKDSTEYMKCATIYIAGPISGYENGNKAAFDKAEKFLKDENNNTIVLSPMHLPAGLTQFSYMDICLAMVRACDAVYFLKGWKNSDGAVAEHALAKKLRRALIFQMEEK